MAACGVTEEVSCAQRIAESTEEECSEIVDELNESDVFQNPIDDLTVNDVYRMAASIGREFEKLTDAFGGAVFCDVMPKIIKVLEIVESFTARSQNYSTDVIELQATVQKLQIDGKSAANKHHEDMEMIENEWRDETRQLLQSIEILREDNKRLAQLLTEKVDTSDENAVSNEQHASVVTALGESVEKQRDELRDKNRIIEQQTAECEALSAQADQLSKLNVNLRRKITLMEKQTAAMASQSTSLESTCREKDRQIKDLQKRVAELGVKLKNATTEATAVGEAGEVAKVTSLGPDPLLTNKLIIDLDDPDRPMYTMHELQEVLSERNSFKLKCILLDDELQYYKQFFKEEGKEDSWVDIDEDVVSTMSEVNNNNNNKSAEDVYKSEGVIKKLFASLFSRNARSPTIPHDPGRPRLPSYLKYNPPLIDESDVMPAIDVRPSPEEELPQMIDCIPSPNGILRFSNDESSSEDDTGMP